METHYQLSRTHIRTLKSNTTVKVWAVRASLKSLHTSYRLRNYAYTRGRVGGSGGLHDL